MSDELKVEKYVEGSGAQAMKGQTVRVHYTGTLENGTKFDSSRDRGEPIEFPLGMGHVISGWDEGIAQLRVGDRAKLTIPARLGYGTRGAPPLIPGDATLIFDVELVSVH
ncbi:FKBP-type peptidyl-prolyl cis-trans isomerase [Deinococcus sp.]|uniref:FKBP-type peptidyl-prolyl cis-trans isomerase n=1 Tax=Deinococcus sp. TaxID=47478 RepID=UPI003C7DE60B